MDQAEGTTLLSQRGLFEVPLGGYAMYNKDLNFRNGLRPSRHGGYFASGLRAQ
jgi:hypothetical protein